MRRSTTEAKVAWLVAHPSFWAGLPTHGRWWVPLHRDTFDVLRMAMVEAELYSAATYVFDFSTGVLRRIARARFLRAQQAAAGPTVARL